MNQNTHDDSNPIPPPPLDEDGRPMCDEDGVHIRYEDNPVPWWMYAVAVGLVVLAYAITRCTGL
jgi:hypothetical protein